MRSRRLSVKQVDRSKRGKIKYFFKVQLVVNIWNFLPHEIVEANSISRAKYGLDKFMDRIISKSYK